METPSSVKTQESNGNHLEASHVNTDSEQGDENSDENTNNNQHHNAGGGLHPPLGLTTTPRSSVEDLSEYTDADESISSAPTEFLAEFLSAVMLKDYETALKYCKLILQYEPNNATAKEFYPLIVEKLQLMEEQEESNSSSNSDRSEDSGGGNDDSSSDGEEKPTGSSESDSDATTASYSSLEDEEADASSGHEKNQKTDNADAGNGNDTKGASVKVSSIAKLINEMVMETPVTISVSGVTKSDPATTNIPAFQSTSSDSESPTEPVSQPTIAQLRAKVVPGKAK
ncbi:uncharacterized protein [Periplaneta americana]|uniref:Glutamate-rich protein 2 n=1 Tax=Periplaneta americana TaxID=6978 RepID=A0ABQ8TVV3_PERAM|nr:hypothetical protein ANN_01681 [Periplaneta americana]